MTPESKSPSSTDPSAAPRSRRKVVEGRVVSAKMQKTAVVQIVRLVRHAKYGKFLRHYTKYYVHDPEKLAGEGDLVEIMETRPLSRLKRWRLVRIIEKSDRANLYKASEPDAEIAAGDTDPQPNS